MKKVKMTFWTKVMIILAILLSMYIAVVLFNPLRWPTGLIQMRILKLTPLGTSMNDVIKVIENNNKWKLLHSGDFKSLSQISDNLIEYSKDRKIIVVQLGTYHHAAIIPTHVSVTWRFDDDLRLIKVEVDKSTDVF